MALTETLAKRPEEAMATVSTGSSISGNRSLRSIKSLSDIPFVDSSFDGESNTLMDGRQNVTASLFSTPRYNRVDDTSPIQRPYGHQASKVGSKDSILSHKQESTHSADTQSYNGEQNARSEFIDEVTRAGGAVASMNEYIEDWAPTAHHIVVSTAALKRDAAELATKVIELSRNRIDPGSFASQYYHLREAYASLFTVTQFNSAIRGDQGETWASPKNSAYKSSKESKGLEPTWDERQLLDSFITLLRTSPGFLSSAMCELEAEKFEAFCKESDGSALNTLFYGVLGSAGSNRPRILAEVVQALNSSPTKQALLTESISAMLLGLAMGDIRDNAKFALERVFRSIFSNNFDDCCLEMIFYSCIPEEYLLFLRHFSDTHWQTVEHICSQHLREFIIELIVNPHRFGLMSDLYIGERHSARLESFADDIPISMETLMAQIRRAEKRSYDGKLWQSGELIALKGSDIISMFHALLPDRRSRGSSSQISSTSSSDEDGWCLDSIRSDLESVMHELSHATYSRSDGWQVFKLSIEGLVTDLGSDMGLIDSSSTDSCYDPLVPIVCDAVARYDGSTAAERISAAREDARQRGDHIAAFSLSNVVADINEVHVNFMHQKLELLRGSCRFLRYSLDQAAREHKRQRERLARLLSILDCTRIHVWYETEIRSSSPFGRSREFLQSLYPEVEGDETETTRNSEHGAFSNNSSNTASVRSRRLSILSSSHYPESPFYGQEAFFKSKLSDKEVDVVATYMRRNRIRNMIPAEERFHRALVEVASLSKRLLDRDHLASYVSFKRDRFYNNDASKRQSWNRQYNGRSSQHHRRSSLGLFDFFDGGGHYASQQQQPLSLHTTTSTQYLGLSSSHDSLKNPSVLGSSLQLDEHLAGSIEPPRHPTVFDLQALLVSDIAEVAFVRGTETDRYMRQTGSMLLEGDAHDYQPLLNDISAAASPLRKLKAIESLVKYTYKVLERQREESPIERTDVIQELGRRLCREPGTIFRDVQIVSTLIGPGRLDRNYAYEDCCTALNNVMKTVVLRSMDYAARYMQYTLESTNDPFSRMAIMGLSDSAAIWEFCAKYGNAYAQRKIADLYSNYSYLKMELRPLSKPSQIVDSADPAKMREAVALHWLSTATRV